MEPACAHIESGEVSCLERVVHGRSAPGGGEPRGAGTVGSALSIRSWPLWEAPARVLVYVFSVEALAVAVWISTVMARSSWPSSTELGLFAVCLLGSFLAVVLELRIGTAGTDEVGFSSDDVWAGAAMVGLGSPMGMVVLAPATLCATALNARLARAGRELPGRSALMHRAVFNGAQSALAFAGARAVFVTVNGGGHVTGGGGAAAAVLAAAVFSAVQTTLVGGAVRLTIPDRSRTAFREMVGREPTVMPIRLLGVMFAIGWGISPWILLLGMPMLSVLQRATLHTQLLAQSRTDRKTGLANAEHWRLSAEPHVARAARGGRPVSVLLLDLDHFKAVNDTYGHLVGDDVLKEVAGRLLAAVRPGDVVGRLGGEEFEVLLPDADRATARLVAHRCRDAIRSAPMSGGIGVKVTASFGFASTDMGSTDLVGLLESADQALYVAKQRGRDRIVGAAAPEAPPPQPVPSASAAEGEDPDPAPPEALRWSRPASIR